MLRVAKQSDAAGKHATVDLPDVEWRMTQWSVVAVAVTCGINITDLATLSLCQLPVITVNETRPFDLKIECGIFLQERSHN